MKAKEEKATENNETKTKETSFFSKSAAAVDVKTKEVEENAFKFANLIQIKPNKTYVLHLLKCILYFSRDVEQTDQASHLF